MPIGLSSASGRDMVGVFDGDVGRPLVILSGSTYSRMSMKLSALHQIDLHLHLPSWSLQITGGETKMSCRREITSERGPRNAKDLKHWSPDIRSLRIPLNDDAEYTGKTTAPYSGKGGRLHSDRRRLKLSFGLF